MQGSRLIKADIKCKQILAQKTVSPRDRVQWEKTALDAVELFPCCLQHLHCEIVGIIAQLKELITSNNLSLT